jgi:large subunit ribosomal protein L25
MDQPVLSAQVRKTKGKAAARKLRANNQIPAVFYGPKIEPVMLVVDYPELKRVIKQGTGENILLDLQVQSDQGTETRKAMLKELITDPIKDTVLHADFYEISMDKKITVSVPIHLINTAAGAENGGILQHIRRELTVSCLPENLIDSFDVDVSGLEIGDSLHIRDIEFPEGIKSINEGHLTVAVVAAPTVAEEVEVEEEVVEEKAAEPEMESAEEESVQTKGGESES